ncbi:hypothetical protein Moror_16262 [Moniliophthora roreri MCA 2997]|uniref:BTB domain-containing protein n=2 Tax=Moniliophthora roreri TaxID=221103 RepID=V2YCC8_MONRO|nr:hypothetical protein Moror_16262 [Moniliophthora roreri MCA 2997]KAI3597878.1 mfs allantoate [Moniliophthora roreri]
MSEDVTASNDYVDLLEPPFNHPDADVIVRSISSKVDFRVIRSFLSFASPVWQSMLLMPQAEGSKEMKDGLAIIPLEEDHDTLETLLRFCYPLGAGATMPPLQFAAEVFEAARKYCLDGVESAMMKQITELYLHTQPLHLFAFATRFGMYDERRIAARQTLCMPLLERSYIDELEWITAGSYIRLQEYHIRCGEVASNLAQNLDWVTRDSYVWFECTECARRDGATWVVTISENRRKWVYSKWWQDFMTVMGRALRERPSPATVKDQGLVDEALGKACAACQVCRTRVFGEMREFCELLAEEVDETTKAIVLF